MLTSMRCLFLLALLAAPALSQDAFTRQRGVVYAQRGNRKMKLDVYTPKGKGPHPWALVLHGGGWIGGFRQFGDPVLFSRGLAREGIAAVAISYRLAPRHPHPAQIEDCRRALQFVRHHAARWKLAPDRVAAVGASAGGHLGALLGTQRDHARPLAEDPVARRSTRVRCVVACCAPMSLQPHADEAPHPTAVRLVAKFLGVKDPQDAREAARALVRGKDASPLAHLDRGDAPLFLVHGMRDPLVKVIQSRRMARAARRVGVPCELVEIPDGRHGEWLGAIGRDPCPQDYWPRALRFLKKHL